MKIFVLEGIVTAQAETEQEMKKLFSFREVAIKQEQPKREYKRHKREYRKPCDICGKMVKRVNLHKTLKHGTTPITPGRGNGRWFDHPETRKLSVNTRS